MSMYEKLLQQAEQKRKNPPPPRKEIKMEFLSYDMEIIEMLMIQRVMMDYPNEDVIFLAGLLGISKSSFYRKFKKLSDLSFKQKLIEHGYTVKHSMVPTEILVKEIIPQDDSQDH